MKIRVLHIIDHLGYGGAPVVVRNLAEKVDSGRIETIVCTLRTNPEAMPVNTRLINLGHNKYNPFVLLSIAKLCKELKIDIIHAHLQKSIMSSLLLGFFCPCKIIIHEHGPIFRGGTGFMYRLFLRVLGTKAVMAIANSQATKAALSRTTGLHDESIHIISNFIDFSQFDPLLYDRQKARKTLGIPENQTVIGFVGRLDQCKGVDLLINTAGILCESGDQYRFVIIGEGKERKELEKLTSKLGLEEKVIFNGLSKNPAELMIAFDIAVIPSRREAFGIAAVELMRMRIPVIASPVGGLVELIDHKKTGIVLDSLNTECIADSIKALVHDSSLLRNIADNAEIFSRKFDGQEQIEHITRIYEKLYSGNLS